jgi:HD superfamily phosphohydrolase
MCSCRTHVPLITLAFTSVCPLPTVSTVCKALPVASKTVRDPIHGMIFLDEKEWAAVNSRVFQRLREIHQLAMTYLVYPGTTHTRFEHSIGVCHIAGRLARKVGVTKEAAPAEYAQVRQAALLHDIGHGPFSHVSEGVIDEVSGVKGCHEAISAFLIRNDAELVAVLGQEACDAAARLVEKIGPRTFLGDIVSGPTDADKLDYLLRDSRYAGVEYGHYDLDRLVDTATVIDKDQPESFLGFERDGVWAVEALLLARHHMHRQVYGHKTRVATDIMVTRALKYGIEEGALPAAAYKVDVEDGKPKVTPEFARVYLKETDASVMERLLAQDPERISYKLADRLRSRDLLRRTATVALHRERQEFGKQQYGRILDRDRFEPRRAELESEIAAALGCEPQLIALYVDSQTNPTYRGPGAQINSGDIMLAYHDAQPDSFERESEIFAEESREGHSFAHLYTPLFASTAQQDKAKELLWEALKKV